MTLSRRHKDRADAVLNRKEAVTDSLLRQIEGLPRWSFSDGYETDAISRTAVLKILSGEREQTPAPTRAQVIDAVDAAWAKRFDEPGLGTKTMGEAIADAMLKLFAPAQPPAPTPLEPVICAKCGQDRASKFSTCPPCPLDAFASGAAPTLASAGEGRRDSERLDWLDGQSETYCHRDYINRWGASWVFFVDEAALDANEISGCRPTVRDAIDAVMTAQLHNRNQPFDLSAPKKQEAVEVSGPTLAEGEATPEKARKAIKAAANELRMRIDHEGTSDLPCECHQHRLIYQLDELARASSPSAT